MSLDAETYLDQHLPYHFLLPQDMPLESIITRSLSGGCFNAKPVMRIQNCATRRSQMGHVDRTEETP